MRWSSPHAAARRPSRANMSASPLLLVAVLAVLAVLAAAFPPPDSSPPTPPEVTVSAGSLRGKWTSTRYGRAVAAFEGVPYAKPPVGELRFQPPQPAEPWSGVRDAVQTGNTCAQKDNPFFSSKTMGVASEDCLYLNVYAPQTVSRATPLPVLVFIHGGAWFAGSGSVYGPEYILDRDVLLVTINYRLGALGFLSTGDDVLPGNNGLKDMVLALQWVRDNIRQFGGDPNLVTVFGESAGGAAVHMLTLSPKAKGLFQRAIAMSGSAFAPWALTKAADARRNAAKLAGLLGCPAEPTAQLRDCLRAKPADDILAASSTFARWVIHPIGVFTPVVEAAGGPHAFLDAAPEQAYEQSRVVRDASGAVPYMTGFVSQEGCLATAAPLGVPALLADLDARFPEVAAIVIYGNADNGDARAADRTSFLQKARKLYLGEEPLSESNSARLTDFFSDSLFVSGSVRKVKLHKKFTEAPVFMYKLEFTSARSFAMVFGAQKPIGMCHVDDLLYLFPLKLYSPQDANAAEEAYSNKLLDLFVRFAQTGRPTADNSWKAVRHADRAEYLHITSASNLTMRTDYQPDRMKLWTRM